MTQISETIFLYQFNSADIGHLSYYLESNKQAIIVDPLSDIAPYIQQASSKQAKIKYILNTNINSDYVSGCFDLAIKTGAKLIFGPDCNFRINSRKVNKEEMEKEIIQKVNVDEETEVNNLESIKDIKINKEDEKDFKGFTEDIEYDQSLKDYLENFNLKISFLNNNDIIQVGNIEIHLLHTPGHTIDSCCYLIVDMNKKSNCIFSGDTILIGDVGRPDMSLVKERGDLVLQHELAEKLYNSIKYLREILPHDLIIYPTKSELSPVSNSILPGQSTTLKQELIHNKFIQEMPLDKFLNLLNEDNYTAPEYFSNITKINISYFTGKNFDYKMQIFSKEVELDSLIYKMNEKEVFIVDARFPFTDFTTGYIPGSLILPIKSPFSIWGGFLINTSSSIVIVSPEGKEKECISRLIRVGFNNILGFLKGGYNNYFNNYKQVCKSLGLNETTFSPVPFNLITEKKTIDYVYNTKTVLLDVREQTEKQKDHSFPNSLDFPLTKLKDDYKKIPKNEKIYLICRTGIRASMAYSLLIMKGFKESNLVVLEGGLSKIIDKGVKI